MNDWTKPTCSRDGARGRKAALEAVLEAASNRRHTSSTTVIGAFVPNDSGSTAIQLAERLLQAVHARRPTDFAGLGIVLCVPPIDFPSVPLGGWLAPRPTLPLHGVESVIDALIKLSSRSSLWHDGFHLINHVDDALTEVSQFLAPDLREVMLQHPSELPKGARRITAMLVSGYPSVACVGLLAGDDQISIFQKGRLQVRMSASCA